MLTKKFVLVAVMFSFLVAPMSMLRAQDAGALLDLLVRKKLINDQEAEEVRAELTKEAATTSGGKWKLSSPITELELYGDVRVRYEYRGGSTEAPQGYSKEGGKEVVATQAASEPFKMKIDVFANFAQFVYDDANPENPIGPRATTTSQTGRVRGNQLIPNTDAFLLAWQVGARFTFPKTLYVQIAPTIYNYTGSGDSFNIHFRGGEETLSNTASMATNQTGINSLLVFDAPMEVGWKIGELPMRIFGDFAVNLEGDERAKAALHPGKGDQRYAYQIGAGIGQLKVKHDWQIEAFWQHSEQYSLDPNLVDSDIFDGRVNMEGAVVRAGYALSDAIIFNLTWGYGWRSDNSLGTGGAHDIAINPLDQYQIFQADLNVKF